MARSTVTGVVKLMERKGLIRRESVSSDARLKKLVLTEKRHFSSQDDVWNHSGM